MLSVQLCPSTLGCCSVNKCCSSQLLPRCLGRAGWAAAGKGLSGSACGWLSWLGQGQEELQNHGLV